MKLPEKINGYKIKTKDEAITESIEKINAIIDYLDELHEQQKPKTIKNNKDCEFDSFWDCHSNKEYCKKHFRI